MFYGSSCIVAGCCNATSTGRKCVQQLACHCLQLEVLDFHDNRNSNYDDATLLAALLEALGTLRPADPRSLAQVSAEAAACAREHIVYAAGASISLRPAEHGR